MERMSDAENPNLKPWAQELMRKYNQDVLHGHRAFFPIPLLARRHTRPIAFPS